MDSNTQRVSRNHPMLTLANGYAASAIAVACEQVRNYGHFESPWGYIAPDRFSMWLWKTINWLPL